MKAVPDGVFLAVTLAKYILKIPTEEEKALVVVPVYFLRDQWVSFLCQECMEND